jgi:hypothetical protein
VTALETQLASPLAPYALEQLRSRFLFFVVDTHDPAQGAFVAAQMAFETEIGAILTKIISASLSVAGTKVPSRRRFLDVDKDIRGYRFLVEPALSALEELRAPDPYVNLLRRHLGGDYPRYRMCAIAATLSFAVALS